MENVNPTHAKYKSTSFGHYKAKASFNVSQDAIKEAIQKQLNIEKELDSAEKKSTDIDKANCRILEQGYTSIVKNPVKPSFQILDHCKRNYNKLSIKEEYKLSESTMKAQKIFYTTVNQMKAGNVREKNRIFTVFYKLKKMNGKDCRPLVSFNRYLSYTFSVINNCMMSTYPVDLNIRCIRENLHLEMEGCKEPYVLIFLDFKSAFDSIRRDFIRNIMPLYGLEEWQFIIDFLDVCYYSYNKSKYSKVFKKYGIPQGVPVSTYLFSLAVRHITGKHAYCFTKVYTFVDDICLVVKGKCLDNLQSNLNKLLYDFTLVGLHLNYDKSKFLTNIPDMNLCLTRIEGKTTERYLGGYITEKFTNPTRNFIAAISDIEQELSYKKTLWSGWIETNHRSKEFLTKVERSIVASFSWYATNAYFSLNSRTNKKIHTSLRKLYMNVVRFLCREHGITLNCKFETVECPKLSYGELCLF